MNKRGIIIGICCAVVVLVIIAIAIVSGAKSPKALAKSLGSALESEEKIEKYYKKNVDFKTLAALDKWLNAGITYDEISDAKKATESFEKAYKEVSKDDIEKVKENNLEGVSELALGKKVKVKEYGELENSEDGLKNFQTMKVTYEDEENNEYVYVLTFYKKKLVSFALTSSVLKDKADGASF